MASLRASHRDRSGRRLRRALAFRLSALRVSAPAVTVGIAALLAGCVAFTWAMGGTSHVAPHYFYLPVLLAASRFGYTGGLFSGLTAAALAGSIPADIATRTHQAWSDAISRGTAFVIVGLVMAGLIGRHTRQLRDQLATVEIENGLRRALQRGELRVHYQPLIRLADGTPIGAEALLRWQHPRRGLLGPAEFIAVAEASELIHDIGTWVLEEACLQGVQWQLDSPLDSVHVGVNVSAQQLSDPALCETVRAVLTRTGLPPECLILEMTETALIGDLAESANRLRALQSIGVQIAVDDYGTGYGGLVYLQRLPIDIIKVDRAFVAGMTTDARDHAIVESVVRLATQLSKRTIAEGVETAQQAEALRALGCETAQGFLFSPAVPAAEFTALLRRSWHVPQLV